MYRYNVAANFVVVLVHSDSRVAWLDHWLIIHISHHLTRPIPVLDLTLTEITG